MKVRTTHQIFFFGVMFSSRLTVFPERCRYVGCLLLFVESHACSPASSFIFEQFLFFGMCVICFRELRCTFSLSEGCFPAVVYPCRHQ